MKKIFSHLISGGFAILIFTGFFLPHDAEAAVLTSTSAGGLWTAGTTWVGGVAPANADSVIIATTGGNSVTIGAGVTNAGLTVNSGAILNFTGAFTLTENGNISVSGTISGATGIVKMNANPLAISGSGTISSTLLIQQPASIAAGSNLTISGIITLANTLTVDSGAVLNATEIDSNAKTVANNGTVNLSGNYLRTGGTSIWTQGVNAVVNIGGNFTPSANITLNASASGNTVNYNGAGQAVEPATYANLILSGSGEKTIATGTSVGGNLSIAPTGSATANIGAGLTITANSLTLGGLGRINGTWGSTSSAATNKTNTYFSATTGILSVTADIRSTPTLSVTNSPVIYSGSPQAATVSGSVSGSASNIKYDGSSTAPANAGTYAVIADFAPTDGTSYTSLTAASAGNFVISPAPGDATSPAAVSNLSISSPTTSSLNISWTAPGDDNNTGTATSYDLRYSTSVINDGNFSSATQVAGEPAPEIAGTSQSMTVSGLSSGTTYYFALKTSDEVPNISAISNVPSGTTSASADITSPAAVSNLSVSGPTPSALGISWTAPGDDNNAGTATSYDLRYSTSVINDGNFSSATAATGEPVPSVAGSSESMTVSGLSSGTTYYFALKTSDEVPNISAISNVPSGTTSVSGDSTAPVITAFAMPATAASSAVSVTSFTVTDNVAVTGYLITESASTPSGSDSDWSASAPTSFIFSGSGAVTAHAWARDAAGNISAGATAVVTISFPSAGSFSGGGPNVMPTTIGMSGKAYPGARVVLAARQSGGVISENRIPVLPKGDFSFILSEIPQGNYTYSLLAEDKDSEKSQVKVFNVDFISASLFERRILLSPTIRIGSPAIRKGDILKVSGYAYPGNKIILNLGDINFSTTTPETGLYEFSINTSLAAIGNNFTRVRQIDPATSQESDWSVTKNFEVLPFITVSLDFNRDGIINIMDWSIFLSRSKTKDPEMVKTIDFNQDGKIDISDFSIFLRNFKK